MPSSVCSFARFVSLLPSNSLSFSISRSRPHLHTQRQTGSNGGSVRPPPAIVQPASRQPASQPSSQPARVATTATSVLPRHEEQKRERGTSHRLLPRRHRETNSYRGADPHRRDPRRSCRTPFFFLPLHHRSVIARRS